MNKENSCAPRAFAGCLVNQLKPACLHGFEGPLCAFHAESHMSQTAAATVPVDQFLYRRPGSQRLKQLDQVGTVAYLQQRFAHLVGTEHFFTMNLCEAQHLRSEEHT